ncbi:MAG TPA: metallophosphoesterase, partial [Methylomirabilota bacterium]|nr:metallophosphoesterase [Methylomirabilota bacterium]
PNRQARAGPMRIAAIRAIIAATAFFAPAASPCAAAQLPFKPGAGQGVFLHVSDLHFYPFADQTIVRRLIAAPIEQWAAIFRSSRDTPFWDKSKDTTFPLLAATLAAAKGPAYDYVLSTGDMLAHDFKDEFLKAGGAESEYAGFVAKTMRFVDRMIEQSFPGIPLIATLGNNDSTCGDYRLAPSDPMLAPVGRGIPYLARHPQALRDFTMGGSYVVAHPKVPNHDMVVLSDVFWSRNYQDACAKSGGDPGSAELAFLEWTLYQAKLAGRTVSLVMHIPPGIDSYKARRNVCPVEVTGFWQDAYAQRFATLVARYKDQLRLGFAGHTHMDDFRLMTDADGAPLLATRVTPAVSPLFGNNPAFTVMLYSRTDASVVDYATFYLANLAKAGADVAPAWKLEYTFKAAYAVPGYDAATLAALAKRIRTDDAVRASFMAYYAVESGNSAMKASNWNVFACAQTAITPDAYRSCVCPGAAPDRGPANAPPR